MDPSNCTLSAATFPTRDSITHSLSHFPIPPLTEEDTFGLRSVLWRLTHRQPAFAADKSDSIASQESARIENFLPAPARARNVRQPVGDHVVVRCGFNARSHSSPAPALVNYIVTNLHCKGSGELGTNYTHVPIEHACWYSIVNEIIWSKRLTNGQSTHI